MSNLNQLLVNVIRVPAAGDLGPGDSITINPELVSNQKPVVPTLIQPDRATAIVVDTGSPITSTAVTFRNDGTSAAHAYFRFERGVSVELDAETLTTSYWAGVTAAGGGGFSGVSATAPIASSNPGGPTTTISLNNSGVVADTYGDVTASPESKMPTVTVTAKGLVSAASEAPIQIGGSPARTYVDAAAATALSLAKIYAEELAFGIASKEPAHVTTTAALPTYTFAANALTATANGPIPSATTDGQTVLAGERILVKDEPIGQQKYNGIYELTQAGDGLNPWILTRTADADTDQEICGALVSVETGLTNAGTLWLFSANPATFDINVDPIIWNSLAIPNATTGAPGAVQLVGGLGGTSSAYNAPRLDADYINKGTLAVGRGGTGTGSLTARAALVANAAGTAVSGVSPGASGNVLTSDGTDWTSAAPAVPVVAIARTYYVTVGGNDITGNGSISKPYATIQKAHDAAVIAYPAGEQVVISVGAGNFATGTKITISRFNTFIVGQGARPEDQVTRIADPIEIDCPAATQLFNEQVGIDGCFVGPSSSFTDAAIEVTGTGQFSTVITNCYATTINAAATASAVRSSATVGRVILWNCITTVQAASAAAYIIDLGDGNHRVADTQIQHGSSVLNTATSAAFALSGASYAFLDRVLITTRTNQYQIVINGTPYSGTTQMVLSNASIDTQPSVAPTSSGIDHSGSGALLLTDVFFTVPAARRCVNAGATSPVVYGQLSFATGFSTSIVATVIFYTNELHGEMYLNALTASLPLKLNASKKVISQAISLSGSEVTGTLPLASVAGPTGIGFGVTSATGIWAAASISGTDKLVGFSGSTPAAITVSTGLSLVAGVLTATGSGGTVTSVSSTSALLSVANGTTTPQLTINTGTTSSTVAIGNDARFNPTPSGAGKIAYDNGTGYVAATAGTANQVLHGGATPSFSAVSLTAGVTGTLPVTNGGTNNNAAPTTNGSVYFDGSKYTATAVGTTGQVLVASAGAPAFQSYLGSVGTAFTWRSLDTGLALAYSPSAATTIPVLSPVILLTPTGSVVMSASPQIQTAVPVGAGTRLTIVNNGSTPSDTITFTDAGTLAGSGIQLGGVATRTLQQFQSIDFVFDGTYWIERAVGGSGVVQSVTAASANNLITIGGTTANPTVAITGLAGANPGTSGGVPYFNAANSLASSAALGQYRVVVGGGAGAAPATLASAGSSGQVLTSNGAAANPSFQSIPYDVAGSVAGTPTASVKCFFFVATRAFSITATGHQAVADTAPSGDTIFTVEKNGVSIGTFTIPAGGSVAFSLTATSFAAGDKLTVTAPAALNGLADLYFTFNAVCP